MSFTLVYLNDYAVFALWIHLISSTLYLIYFINTKPFTDKDNTKFEIINEYFVCIGAMYIFLYTNNAYDTDTKEKVGWCYLGFNCVSLIIIFRILL